jgi:type I restriction enzyme M protein
MPFIRTSDISNWELKADPKQSVSEIIYEANKQDVRSEDIFLVRDGTYLVGTSAIVTARDEKVLFSGGIYKLRVLNRAKLNPYLFLALLNTPIVRRQMRAKQFTRDIIDTLGKRLFEVAIPIPKDQVLRLKLTRETQGVIEKRTQLLGLTKRMAAEVEGISTPQEDNLQLVQEKQFSNSGCHGA